MRQQTAYALGNIGSEAKEAVPALKRLAERDPIEDVRRIAREALKKIGK